jgi:hypothetical protein
VYGERALEQTVDLSWERLRSGDNNDDGDDDDDVDNHSDDHHHYHNDNTEVDFISSVLSNILPNSLFICLPFSTTWNM